MAECPDWSEVYPQFGTKGSVGSVINRLDAVLAAKPPRYFVSQRRSTLDVSDIMNMWKIFLSRLSQGVIGKENANLLGSLIVTKLQQSAMGRQRIPEHERRDHWLCIDEFQSFITPSLAEILTEARNYRLGLILAHQTLAQLDRNSDVANAVNGTINVRAVFRVGAADAKA